VFQRFFLTAAVALTGTCVRADGPALDSMRSYPITIDPSQVREFSSLTIDFAGFEVRGKDITVIPISTEVGLTGVVLFGSGTYVYAPAPAESFTGEFRAAMLRFNPADADAIIKLSDGKAVVDKGASELAKVLLASVFRHCYHSGMEALIPSEGAIAADVISRELGDVLFSIDDKTAIVYNFSDRKMLYEKK